MNPNRRRALSLLATGLTSLAGCLATDGSESDSTQTAETTDATEMATPSTATDPTRLAVGSPFETEDRTVAVENARVQKSIEEFTGVHTDIASIPGYQFVVVDVRTEKRSGDAQLPRMNEFAAEVDGEIMRAGRTSVLLNGLSYESPETYAFAIRTDPAPESISIVWKPERVRWEVESEMVAAIADEPRFDVRSFSIPDEIERGSEVRLGLTVANVGEADGTFRAELGSTAMSDQGKIAVDVPRGETVSYDETGQYYLPDGDEASFVLDWGEDALVRTADVIEPATGTRMTGGT